VKALLIATLRYEYFKVWKNTREKEADFTINLKILEELPLLGRQTELPRCLRSGSISLGHQKHIQIMFPETFMREQFMCLLVQDGHLVKESFMNLLKPKDCGLVWYGLIAANLPNGRGTDVVEERLGQQQATLLPILSWLARDLHFLTKTEEWKTTQAIEQDPNASFL
jgi:hypothetical protein